MTGCLWDIKKNPGWDAWRAEVDAHALTVFPIIRELQATGIRSYRGIARALNERGVLTVFRCQWYSRSVRNLLLRETELLNRAPSADHGRLS